MSADPTSGDRAPRAGAIVRLSTVTPAHSMRAAAPIVAVGERHSRTPESYQIGRAQR